jgi:hypothetical protein
MLDLLEIEQMMNGCYYTKWDYLEQAGGAIAKGDSLERRIRVHLGCMLAQMCVRHYAVKRLHAVSSL